MYLDASLLGASAPPRFQQVIVPRTSSGFWESLSQFGALAAAAFLGGGMGVARMANASQTNTLGASLLRNFTVVALDLNRDRQIPFTPIEQATTYFNLNGDAFREITAWVNGQDGLLVNDLNRNGRVDSGLELVDSLASLAAMDLNRDGTVNSRDAGFAHLRVWRDVNQNGLTETGELRALSAWGITQLPTLGATPNADGSLPVRLGTNTSRLAQVSLQALPFVSQSTEPYTLPTHLLGLAPMLRGYGVMQDLLPAAANNDTLAALLENAANETNATRLYSALDDILAHWAGVAALPPSQRQAAVVARFYALPEGGTVTNPEVIAQTYTRIKDKAFLAWIAQQEVGETLAIGYDFLTDTLSLPTQATLADALIKGLASDTTVLTALQAAQSLERLGMLDVNIYNEAMLRINGMATVNAFLNNRIQDATTQLATPNGTVNADLLLGDAQDNTYYGGNSADALYGGAGDDTLNGMGGIDLLSGGTGNDILLGEAGNDTYLLTPGSGNDLMVDIASQFTEQVRWVQQSSVFRGTYYVPQVSSQWQEVDGGLDTLWLPQTSREDVMFTREGTNLKVSLKSTSTDSATLYNWFGSLLNRIERFVFQNGEVLTPADVLTTGVSVQGSAGNDALSAWTDVNSTLLGLGGDDSLIGRGMSDTLMGGEGNDRLDDLLGGVDTLLGGDGNDFLRNWYGTGGLLEGGGGNDEMYNAYTVNAIINLGDGNDRLQESYASNTLTIGGQGDDLLETLYSGANTYQYNLGDGHDTIIDGDNAVDTVRLGSGITLAMLQLERRGNDLITRIGDGSITHKHFFASPSWMTFQYQFSDGSTAIAIDQTISQTGTEGHDVLLGWESQNVSLGLGGNDTLYGGSKADLLTGGTGADTLMGGLGNDVYQFSAGDGLDTLSDVGGVDRVAFTATVNRSQVVFFETTATGTLTVDYGPQAGRDQVRILNWRNPAQSVETFQLATANPNAPLTLTNTAVQQVLQQLSAYGVARGVVFSSAEQIRQDVNALQLFTNAWT